MANKKDFLNNKDVVITALQGNEITYTFTPSVDLTVYGNAVKKYRYRYYTRDLYADSATTPYYYNDSEAASYSEYAELNNSNGTFNFTIPNFPNDKALWMEIEPHDDETGGYSTSARLTIGPIVVYRNGIPKISCKKVEKNEDGTLGLTYSIDETGIVCPKNTVTAAYTKAFWNAFFPNGALGLNYTIAEKSGTKNLSSTHTIVNGVNDAANFKKKEETFSVSIVGSDDKPLSGDLLIDLALVFAIGDEGNFDLLANNVAITSNQYILVTAKPSCQIRKNGIKVHMEHDNEWTGAGMFSSIRDIPHSIALYDEPSGRDEGNKPSIGFMSNEHTKLAEIVYEGGKLKAKSGNDEKDLLEKTQTTAIEDIDAYTCRLKFL
jgi:hypothetical protein